MKRYTFYIFIFLITICSCADKPTQEYPKIVYMEDSIPLLGSPDTAILAQFIQGDVDKTYLYNNLVSMSLILEPPAIYHCFILEKVGTDKQIYYLKIDDALKYNWIPPYDSLSYDLSLDMLKTERAGTTTINRSTGKEIHYKPDTAMQWSSKFEQLPSMRKNSEEYNKIVDQCDDAQQLADYCNHSLFFQNNSFISSDDKNELLKRLISQTQAHFAEYFFDFDRPSFDIYPIIEGQFYCAVLYSTYKVEDFSNFKNEILEEGAKRLEWLSNEEYPQEHSDNYGYRIYSRYLLNMNTENLNNILNNIDEIENLYNQSSMMFCTSRPHLDFRLFFFNIKYDENNKITIEKNYYNKEYITTTRIRGYYWIY